MRVKLVRIGNSRGLRLTKALLDQCRFGDEVDVEVQDGRLVVSSVPSPRTGWEAAYARMARLGGDRLLDADIPAPLWDRTEWEW